MYNTFKIAIDGPAGAGKSTIAKLVSKKLGYLYVDTGAMYRAMAVFYSRKKISCDDLSSIEKHIKDININIEFKEGNQIVILNGEDITDKLRKQEIGEMASAISVHKTVREKLVLLQRQIAKKNDVVMDGRDIGTHVLTDADVKIYLTASTKTRALRRYNELTEGGIVCDLEAIENEISKRDYRDMNRENSPLKRAEDAIYLDSSDMNIDEVTDFIIKIAKERGIERSQVS